MKQTALDWYWDMIKSYFEHDGDLLESASFTLAIAKEKEKGQIYDAYCDGGENAAVSITTYEQYYNETYENKGNDDTSSNNQ